MDQNCIKDKLKKLQVNEELILETEKEIFVGKLQYVDINLSFIKLNFVKELRYNVSYTSVQLIPVERIMSLRLTNSDNKIPLTMAAYSSEESFSTTEHIQDNINKTYVDGKISTNLNEISLTHFELELLKRQICSVKILNCFGLEYGEAIADIKRRSFVALDVEPHQSGRNLKTTVITIATEDSVYIFDVLSLGKVFEDLQAILEAERPTKIMHNSGLVVDHFEHVHNLKINGISDTYVAHSIVTKQKQNIELEDLVMHYFSISNRFFEKRRDQAYVMYSRPLNESFVRNCAERASFMFKLNECLQKYMLRKYYAQCENFSRTYADNNDRSEVACSMNKNRTSIYSGTRL